MSDARTDTQVARSLAQAVREPDWRRYERMKQQFQQDRPEATPAEYEAAMREFARMCGV